MGRAPNDIPKKKQPPAAFSLPEKKKDLPEEIPDLLLNSAINAWRTAVHV